MKRKILGFCMMVAGLAIAGVVVGRFGSNTARNLIDPSPRFWIASEHVDVGEVMSHRIIRGTLAITNRGRQNLKVSVTGASCGCTRAVLDNPSLKRGESTKLEVEIEARDQDGRFSNYVYLQTNDPRHPQISVEFSGKTIAAFRLKPSIVNLGEVEADASSGAVKVVVSRGSLLDPSDFDETDVYSPDSFLAVEILGRDSEQLQFEVSTLPSMPIGAHRSSVYVSQPRLGVRFELPVLVRAFGRIVLDPETFYFGSVSQNGTDTRRVLLSHSNHNDRVDSVVISEELADIFQVQYFHVDEELVVEGTLDADKVSQSIDERVLLEVRNTEDDSTTSIMIPVIADVRAR